MRGLLAALGLALLLGGCNGVPEMMPLKVGKSWSYHVNSDFDSYFEPVTVVREAAVDGHPGFELQGPMGDATLAWVGKRLVAERLGSSRFDPPLPILVEDAKGSVPWKGTIDRLAGPAEATGELTQSPDTVNLDTRSVKATKATMKLEIQGHHIEFTTWFAPGGIVKQEQLTDGRQNLSMVLISASP